MYDCIIVGAGPAGSSAAYQLARYGRRVLILEKAAWPRCKPCSGAVSPRIAEWFDFDLTPAIDSTCRQVRYTWKFGEAIAAELETPDPIWLVRRDRFDAYLVDQAMRQGAVFQAPRAATGIQAMAEGWTVNTADGDVQGHYLIAADGANGPVSTWLGLPGPAVRQAALLTIARDIATSASPALSFEFGSVSQGCMWCFPNSQAYTIGAATFLGSSPKTYHKPLERYALALGAPYDPDQVQAQSLKLWDGPRPLQTQRAVVVGEAAAIVDPLTAEGIRHGIFSGIQAAEAIHQALGGDPAALATYPQAMHEWGTNMQWAQRIAGIFYRVPGIGYRLGIKRPTTTKRMGQLLAGDIQYSDIANRVIKRLSTGFLPGRS